jgi:aminoglycoside phosphotransferase (APT) family kinase protein
MPASENPTPDVPGLLVKAGLIASGDLATVAALSGGVSCEAWRATTADGDYAVKVALPQLRVAVEWHAPVERIGAEARWFSVAAKIVPDAVPELVATLPEENALITRFLPPEEAPVWKQELLAGRVDPDVAAAVGDTLARIHAATRGDAEVAAAFPDRSAFYALRIEAFLLYPGERHANVRPILKTLAEDLAQSREALVHGDVSPKNILAAPGGPVILDAECATMGDPAFDLAFCLTHLLLKAAALPSHRPALIVSAARFARAYGARIGTGAASIDARAARLTAALLLARIDGRSPAEYITDEALKALIRARAIDLLIAPPPDTKALITNWQETLDQ